MAEKAQQAQAKPLRSAPPAPKFAGYRVLVSGFGPHKANDVLTDAQLEAVGVTEARLDQLVERGDLAQEWA